MQEYHIRKYTDTDKTIWDTFVDSAKNGTFLFKRDFMEYHSDRFEDYSLLVFNKKENLVAIIPANKKGNVLHSHQGLTYGGIIIKGNLKANSIEKVIIELITHLKSIQISNFRLKTSIDYYNLKSDNEIDYFLFKMGATIQNLEMNLAIPLNKNYKISKSKLKHFRRICNTSISFTEEKCFKSFWENVLIPRLQKKHNSSPLHSLKEIEYLAKKFPSNIKQYSVYFNDKIVAGITLFETKHVVKSQYGATTEEGEKLRALDYLTIKLTEKFKQEGKAYYDMGTVTKANSYNHGLLQQKEELGCSIYNQKIYDLKIS